jgi:hypothetical protein
MNCNFCKDAELAIFYHHLKCLKYFNCNNTDRNLLDLAAGRGSLEILKYLYEEVGCKWGKYTTMFPGINEDLNQDVRLEILKYLHENGCPWNKLATYVYGINKHFECLYYCLENGCPIDSQLFKILKKRGLSLSEYFPTKIISHPRFKRKFLNHV